MTTEGALNYTNAELAIALQDDLDAVRRFMIKRQVDVFEGLASRLEQAITALRTPQDAGLADEQLWRLYAAMDEANRRSHEKRKAVGAPSIGEDTISAARAYLAELEKGEG